MFQFTKRGAYKKNTQSVKRKLTIPPNKITKSAQYTTQSRNPAYKLTYQKP